MTDYIQVRVDKAEKNKASQIFERLGLDISSAVRMFLKQTIQRNTLPFSFDSTDDYDYISAMDNILAMQAEAEKNNCEGITLDEINKEIEDYRNGK